MKFSENWLRTLVNPNLDSKQLAYTLTMAGIEVEALEPAAQAFEQVVVARVLSVDKHPNADRLKVCQVDVGQNSPLQIVCGAANVVAEAKVPCALVGAQLPGMAIKQAQVRGVDSYGMLCSAVELGLAEQSEGLLLLSGDAPIGKDLRAYLDLNDAIITLKLTPNRSDCTGIIGIAREVAAITASNLKLPEISHIDASAENKLMVSIEAVRACPRYTGRIIRNIDLKKTTPDWMARRLERSGIRTINAVVDVTNYVMLELGQPMHAFDLAKIDTEIRVRFAKAGEQLNLLNQQQITLQPDMLIIADQTKALALAGIMGGLDSAVNDGTTDIFLESAFFDPVAIAGKSRALNLHTDSSYRFERGVDFAITADALNRATQLLVDICGGIPGAISEVRHELPKREPIQLRVDRARRVLGINLDDAYVEALLRRLQFSFAEQHGVYFITPPSYRFDLTIEADLIEELARLHGYDNIPAAAPKAPLNMLAQPEATRSASDLKKILVARDYQEVISYSFVESSLESDFGHGHSQAELQNPLSSQLAVMRSSLLGSLVNCLRYNLNRQEERVRLFEIGNRYEKTQLGFQEIRQLAGLCFGSALPEQWGAAARDVDFYDVKSDIQALYSPRIVRFQPMSADRPYQAMHPTQSTQLLIDSKAVGWFGVLHPRLQQKYEIPGSVILFELDVAELISQRTPVYQDTSKFPLVRRDISVVVEEGLAVQDIVDAVQETLPAHIVKFELFDVYRGKGIGLGKKGLAFRVLLQDTQKTLTDDEVNTAVAHIMDTLSARFNANLRT